MLYNAHMNMKKMLIFPLLAASLLLAGCAAQSENASAAPETETPAAAALSPSGEGGALALDLSDTAALPYGASYDSGVITITTGGVYRLTGSFAGQLQIDTKDAVELILAGASLTGQECVNILSDAPVTITAEARTENLLSDGAKAVDSDAHATVFSKAPLTIGGEGSITVTAAANNGIQSKDSLTVTGGSLAVNAANHGLKSRGALTVTGGNITVNAGKDGLTAEAGRLSGGNVSVTGGTLTINAVCDGIQAENDLTVSGGTLDITTGGGGGGAINRSGEEFGPMMWTNQEAEPDVSAKGLKSDGSIYISGAAINLNTADDAIHCATLCTVDSGDITILSSDDAIHCDDWLVINGGNIDITDCFEGLEAFAVDVNGGDIIIRSVNDGINANGPEMFGFGMNQQATAEITSLSGQGTTYFRQTGGSIDLVVTGNYNNAGDGVDSNGSVYISGGTLTVSTLGNTREGGVDYGGGEFVITGGALMAGGSSMMQESISTASTQCSAVLAVNSQAAGTVVTITGENGNEIWSVPMANVFTCLVLSHPDMTPGHIYTVTYGTASSTLDFTGTTVINMSGGFGFGGPGGGRPF